MKVILKKYATGPYILIFVDGDGIAQFSQPFSTLEDAIIQVAAISPILSFQYIIVS